MGDYWSVLLGFALAVIAGYIGVLINGRHEHKKWLRDEKMQVYAAFLKAQEDLASALRGRRYHAEAATEKGLAAVQAHRDARMDLVASAPINAAIGRLGACSVAILLGSNAASTEEGQRLFEDACEDHENALDEVVKLMRRDLGTEARPRAGRAVS